MPHPDAVRRAAGPAGALVGARRRDFLNEKAYDSPVRIEARDPREAAVNHSPSRLSIVSEVLGHVSLKRMILRCS